MTAARREYVQQEETMESSASPRSLYKPRHAPHASHCNEADSFFATMRFVVLLAQPFGLFPVSADSVRKTFEFKLDWFNWRFVYTVFCLSGSAFLLGTSLVPCFQYGFTYDKSKDVPRGSVLDPILVCPLVYTTYVTLVLVQRIFFSLLVVFKRMRINTAVVFFLTGILTTLYFIKVALRWPQINLDFASMEVKMNQYGHPRWIGVKIKAVSIIFLAAAFVEHALAISTGFLRNVPCSKKEHDGFSILEAYFLNSFYQVFSITQYTAWKGCLIFVFNFLVTFSWSYMNLFLAIVSLSISQRFKQFNKAMLAVQGQEKPSWFWKRAREEYNGLAVLTKKVDTAVQELMMIAIANNLFFICLQMLKSFSRKKSNGFQDVYFFWSFGFLLVRAILVTLYAAGVHDASVEGKVVLYSVPHTCYCDEARRLELQMTTDEVALTGGRFFPVTRGLILTIAGTILTYEIVLVQFNTYAGVESWPTEGNKTFCSKL